MREAISNFCHWVHLILWNLSAPCIDESLFKVKERDNSECFSSGSALDDSYGSERNQRELLLQQKMNELKHFETEVRILFEAHVSNISVYLLNSDILSTFYVFPLVLFY